MTVYHGGYMPVKQPEIRIGRNTKDFENGFYCTIIKEQAQRWARVVFLRLRAIVKITRLRQAL